MKRQLLNLWIILVIVAVFTGLVPSAGAVRDPQQATRFLEPPYYGTTTVTSVFDHQLPLWPGDDGNNWTMHYDGIINGPGARSSYDQHRGIDYALRYDLVRAAAPGRVAEAGWADPANHRRSYGLHVRIDHDLNHDGQSDYRTIYGHMSVLRVQTGDPIPANADEFQRIIGRSGNTGYCVGVGGTGPNGQCTDNDPPTCGAHLHFQLEHNGRVVNPYGWIGNFADPWSRYDPDNDGVIDGATSVDLWLRYPSITNGDVYPSGAPLTAPPINENEPGAFTVDDGDAGSFIENPDRCWTADNTTGWAGDHRWRNVPAQNPGNCTATWNFPGTQGYYNVFVHIPNDNVALGDRRATVDAARYSIRHTVSPSQPGEKQTQIVVVDQWVYPNNAHPSRWVYLGTYYFNNQHSTDYVRLESSPLEPVADTMMAADAVRFAPVRYRVYLPLVLRCYPPIPPATPVLNAISNPTRSPNYTVSWQPASGAETYTLQEATNPYFTSAITVYTGSGTSWAATNKPVGSYYYRVRATNCAGNSGWSDMRSTIVSPSGWITIASQNFEGAFPGNWTVMDGNGSDYGEYYWGKRNCRPYAGSYSGWAVGGGTNGSSLNCRSNYPNDAKSWMIYGPFSLVDASAAEMSFQLWAGTELKYDEVCWLASVNGKDFSGYCLTGTASWHKRVLNLADVPNLGNLLGRSSVWVAFLFGSNSSVTYSEGAYVDNIVLRLCYRECPSGSSASLGSGQTREVSVTRQHSETLGVSLGEPQPFVSPLSVPEPFRSPLPVPKGPEGMPEVFRSPLPRSEQ